MSAKQRGHGRVLVVRHADAGDRHRFEGVDAERPLSKKGELQARALVRPLSAGTVSRLLSSPSVRCRETLQPLSDAIGVPIEIVDALTEDADVEQAWQVLADASAASGTGRVIACSHGPVLEELVKRCAKVGAVVTGKRRVDKGARLDLVQRDGRPVTVDVVGPPAVSSGRGSAK